MTSTERAQTWIGMFDGEAGGEDERAGCGAIARTWSSGASDGVVTSFERYAGSAMPDSLTRAMELAGLRLEKVVRLRLAIASGFYRVSAAELADKMIGSFSAECGLDGRKCD